MSEVKNIHGAVVAQINTVQELGEFHSVGIEGTKVAIAITGQVGGDRDATSKEDARRIAACWNFCEGIETGQMEGNTFEEYVVNQAFINGMTPSDKGMNIDVSGLAAQLMAASFAGQFVGSGAINFLSMHMSHREIGEFVVTMQRKNGVSPAQKLKQAEAQRDELLEVLKHIRRCIPYGGFVQIHDNSMTLAQIDAAIAKAEGGAA